MLLSLAVVTFLTACEIDDTALCDDQDAAQSETCKYAARPSTSSFKIQYTTADGTMPQGRYTYVPSGGAATDSQAEAECKDDLQHMFDTDSGYLNGETGEILYFRGNICGAGYTLRHGLGDYRVTNVRRTGLQTFDYDLELTCTN